MDKKQYMPRIIDDTVDRYLATFGAVCIEGPKWCGKTWTSSYHSNSEILIGDPANNFQNRSLAELSPALVLEGETPRLIDEWQEVPSLWDAVRYTVDQRGRTGQFILTGSATPKRKGILHSGAGRIGKLHMRPMSLYESGESSGMVSLQELCSGSLTPVMTGEVDLQLLAKLTVRGGWPGNLKTRDEDISLLPNEYAIEFFHGLPPNNDIDIQEKMAKTRLNARSAREVTCDLILESAARRSLLIEVTALPLV